MLRKLLALAFIGFELNVALEENGRLKGTRIRHELHNASLEPVTPRYESSRRPCDTEQLEYRLTKLEVQVAEKSENLRSEMREGNRRLQALEWQNAEVQTALESFRNELGRFTETNQPMAASSNTIQSNRQLDKLELRIDNVAKGVQLVVAALRGLSTDIRNIKKNISAIEQETSALLLNHDELVTKPFLSNSLVDVKHHQIYHREVSDVPQSCAAGRKEDLPRNCLEVQERGNNVSGIYRIQPESAPRAFMVLCDMNTRGGGWTYIHNRYEGAQDFYLNWHSYKLGFGNLGGEFWLGLEYLHQLTGNEVNELLVELVDMNLEKAHAHYSAFSIGNEVEGYSLKILGGYSGDAGDSLIYHAGSKFSTMDMDQDGWAEGSCAKAHNGAWWYRGCDTSNLNGKYLNGDLPEDYLYQGMYWGEFRGAQYSLLQARMMVRPRSSRSPPIFPDGIAGSRKH